MVCRNILQWPELSVYTRFWNGFSKELLRPEEEFVWICSNNLCSSSFKKLVIVITKTVKKVDTFQMSPKLWRISKTSLIPHPDQTHTWAAGFSIILKPLLQRMFWTCVARKLSSHCVWCPNNGNYCRIRAVNIWIKTLPDPHMCVLHAFTLHPELFLEIAYAFQFLCFPAKETSDLTLDLLFHTNLHSSLKNLAPKPNIRHCVNLE